jgi:predicted molibdopterin-dependent oxidoreductase YjgC
MMGVCFECLVEIDGSPNHQACMTTVRDGMSIKIQKGLRGVEP